METATPDDVHDVAAKEDQSATAVIFFVSFAAITTLVPLS
jgi:uncharacterized membrane protein